MLYQERNIAEEALFHITAHGHYYLNPYFGCSENCAQCYWPEIPGWSGQITAWVNIPDIFETHAAAWDPSRRIYLGSYCNPYEQIETKYGLTRKLLEIILHYKIPYAIMTSSALIQRDFDLLSTMPEKGVLVFELSRVRRLTQYRKSGRHDVLDVANQFAASGFRVLATVSPYLPEITDLDRLLCDLDTRIALYLGPLDLVTSPHTRQRLHAEVAAYRPELCSFYDTLLRGDQYDVLYHRLLQQYKGESRIRQFPLDIDENTRDETF